MVKFPLRGFDMTPHLARNRHLRNKQQMTASTSEENNLEINQQNEDDENWSPWRRTLRRNQVHHNSSNNTDRNSQQQTYMDNLYDLYAVCYHQGDTLETGHYTAACLNPYDQQWYKFDDHKVSHVVNEVVPEQIVNNEAYILFYQRRKFDDSMECSGTSSTSTSGLDHWVSRIAASTITASMSSVNTVTVPVIVKSADVVETEVLVPLAHVEEKEMVEVKEADMGEKVKFIV
jgi:ubiquitin carboxyl-terminal hydrolase 31